MKKILNLDTSKTFQDSDVPTKILKENADIFTDSLHSRFNAFIKKSEFLAVLKQANIIPAFKKRKKEKELKTMCQRHLKKMYFQASIRLCGLLLIKISMQI